MEGIPTGIDFLDAGADGFYRGKPYLVFGGSGTGKSIFGLQVAHAGLVRGESALYVCREKADDLIQQGERLGFALSDFVDNGQLVLLEYDEGFHDIVTRSGPEAILVELEAEVADLGVRRVILDPIDPFFSSMDDEGIFRNELRALTSSFEALDWTPLLLCDGGVKQSPFVLRVFSEVCWGLFELQRANEDDKGPDHELLVYKMRNVELQRSKFGFRIGEGGITSGVAVPPASGKPRFSRFKPRPRAEVAPPVTPVLPAPEAVQPAPVAPVVRPAPAAAPAPEAVPSEGQASSDEIDLLDDQALAELERAFRQRASDRPAPQPAAPRDLLFEAPAGFALGEGPRTSDAPGPKSVQAAQGARPRLLLIESNLDAQRELEAACGLDVDVLLAEDGVEGLRKAVEERPDVIVMGARMPRLNGIGLCRILREHGLVTPVVLLCSVQVGPGEIPRSLAAGADAALPKPPTPSVLQAELSRLLMLRPPGSFEWPPIHPETAIQRLVPRSVEPEQMEQDVAVAREWAEESGVPISLIGYEFRFVDGKGADFVDHFDATLRASVRAEDAVCRMDSTRLVVRLIDADDAGARAVIGRVHQEMADQASSYLTDQGVKPKALYRLMTLQPHQLTDEQIVPPYLDRLFEEKPRLIEQDLDDRPGEPVEKYPLIEAVYHALAGELNLVTSPLDGQVYDIRIDAGARIATIEGHVYRLQSAGDDSSAALRAQSGAQIAWVETSDGQVVARVEDGRVFRGKEA